MEEAVRPAEEDVTEELARLFTLKLRLAADTPGMGAAAEEDKGPLSLLPASLSFTSISSSPREDECCSATASSPLAGRFS